MLVLTTLKSSRSSPPAPITSSRTSLTTYSTRTLIFRKWKFRRGRYEYGGRQNATHVFVHVPIPYSQETRNTFEQAADGGTCAVRTIELCGAGSEMAEKRPIDEEAVFNVALDVLVCRGYKEATMVELAEATGVQRGTLYHAYGGKEELFLWAFNNL